MSDCTRSHPHENMLEVCRLRTEIARLANEAVHRQAALVKKDEEIQQIREHEYQRGYRDGEAHSQADLDRVMGEAVKWASIVYYNGAQAVLPYQVNDAFCFLDTPDVQSWRARQGKS